jgi:hypothetical protein
VTDIGARTDNTNVLRPERVREAIDKLLSRDTHSFFIAYLWLHRQAVLQGTTDGIEEHYAELAPYLAVAGGPAGKPYLRPFWTGTRDGGQEWLNRNLAGSYGPSSIRKNVRPVVTTNADEEFVLQEDHWEKALHHFLYDEKMPVIALAAFLLRDHGFVSSSPPTADDLIAAFRDDFRYGDDMQHEFDTLFDTSWNPYGDDWFESLPAETEADA